MGLKPQIIISLAGLITLTACSSFQYQRNLDDLVENQNDMSNWNVYQVRAWKIGDMPSDYKSPSEKLTRKVENQCLAGFSDGARTVQELMNHGGKGVSYDDYQAALTESRIVSEHAINCAYNQGADAHFRLVHAKNGTWYDLEGWVKTSHYYEVNRKRTAYDLALAKKKDKETAAAVLGAVAVGAAAFAAGYSATGGGGNYVNPNQHWVSGYYRSDGTYVPGHWRTNPNNTCLDNINGC